VIVLDLNIAGLEGCLSSSEIYRDCVFRHRDCLKQAAFRDPRIEIVNLHVLHGTCEYIKSYEGERAVMVAPVGTDKFTSHKANVGFERKMLGSLASNRVRSHTAHCGPPDEPVEIGDG